MAKNKRGPVGKPMGMTYASILAREQRIGKAMDKVARDTAVKVESSIQTQRAMWVMMCSMADAYGIGPKRMQDFFKALEENTAELRRMTAEVDEDYAFEKLRQRAEQVTGREVPELYSLGTRAALIGKE